MIIMEKRKNNRSLTKNVPIVFNHLIMNLKRTWVVALFTAVLGILKPRTIYAGIVQPSAVNPLCDFNYIFANILSAAVSIAGILLFVMLIFGGFRYLTSGGDQKAVQDAKNTMTYAIAGIALMILAWFILKFIDDFIFGVTFTLLEFNIPCPDTTGL